MQPSEATELVKSAQVVKQEFGSTEVSTMPETASAALAAREQAMIQARFIMAERHPRKIELFRQKLLAECKRPGFAEIAEYSRPVGREFDEKTNKWGQKIATGPSIRFVETALQLYGNVAAESQIIYDTDELRIVRCFVLDLETNATWDKQLTIPKRVEKKPDYKTGGPPKGRQVIGQRVNSEGKTSYLVIATDDEVNVLQSAMESKAQRKNAERLLPSDIVEEALATTRATLSNQIREDPKAAMRKIIDGFAKFNVSVEDLETWTGGKKLDALGPKEISELRRMWQSLRDGDATFDDFKQRGAGGEPGSRAEQRKTATSKLDDLTKKEEESKKDESGQEEQETGDLIDDDQQVRLADRAKELGWDYADFREMLHKAGIKDESLILKSQYDEILKHVEGGPKPEPRKSGGRLKV